MIMYVGFSRPGFRNGTWLWLDMIGLVWGCSLCWCDIGCFLGGHTDGRARMDCVGGGWMKSI